jgi:hypothetical protein
MHSTAPIQIKQHDRDYLSRKTADFLASGGSIRTLSHVERAPVRLSCWEQTTRHASMLRESERRQKRIVQRIKELAVVDSQFGPIARRSAQEIRRIITSEGTRVTVQYVEEMAARHAIMIKHDEP